MKKTIIIIAVLAFSFSGCKKYCFECTDINGRIKAEKCFKSEDDMNVYMVAEVDKPDSERCK